MADEILIFSNKKACQSCGCRALRCRIFRHKGADLCESCYMRKAYDKPEFREEYRQPKEYSRVFNEWERRRIIDEWAVND